MKAKAAVLCAIGSPLQIREFPLPDVEPGAVLVKVSLATICGSDLHVVRGELSWSPLPCIPGHEMTGTIYQLGDNIKTDSTGQPLSAGDRVVYPYWKPCGRCLACISGNAIACPNKYPFRTGQPADKPPHFTGAYAEYYYVSPGQHIFKVPEDLPDEIVAPVNCALSQVLFGLHRVGVIPGDTVVIQGAGGLGLNALAVAREMGAGRIIVIDGFDERLKLAEAFGADHTIRMSEYPTAEERAARVRDLTGRRYADLVIEVTGVAQAISEGAGWLRPGGKYLIMGSLGRGGTAQFDPSPLILRNTTFVFTAWYEPWAIPRALDLLKKTRAKYPFHRLLSHKFPLAEINLALDQAAQGKVTRAAIVP